MFEIGPAASHNFSSIKIIYDFVQFCPDSHSHACEMALVPFIETYLVSPMRNNRDSLLCYRHMFDMSEMFGAGLLYACQQ